MRFREIFRYELAHRLRSPSTWFYGVFLFGLAFLRANVDGGSIVQVNAPDRIADHAALFCGMFGMLVTAALFSDAAIRDFEVEMDPLLFTTRLATIEFLGGRFVATLAVNAVLLLAVPIGLIVVALMPHTDPTDFGPVRMAPYVQTFVLFQLPNLLLVASILFTIAALTRRALPVFLGTMGVFISYLVAANYQHLVENRTLATFLDPLGVLSLIEMTRYWPPAQRNSELIGFPAILVLNRVVWLAIAAGVLAMLYRRFRFAPADGRGRNEIRRAAAVDAPWRPSAVIVPYAVRSRGTRARLRQTLEIMRQSFADVLGVRGMLLTLAASLGLTVLWGWNVGDSVFENATWPFTHLVVQEALSDRNVLIPIVIVVLIAGELVWKHRAVGSAEIVDASPVPESVLLIGRFLTLVLLFAMVLVAFTIGGVLIQVLQGYYRIDLGLYVRILFGLNFSYFVILAALTMTVHVLVNHRYIGHIIALLAILLTELVQEFGIRHNLLRYGNDPGWTYSDMNGFGPFIPPVLWFRLYWSAWAMLLLVVAVLFWVRGTEPGLRRRLASARARFAGPVARAAGVAFVLILGLGGFIFYNTNVLNHYTGEPGLLQAEYEKRYARFKDAPQPAITDATLRIEIYPEQPAVDLRGTYRLANRGDRAIDSVHLFLRPTLDVRSFSFDSGARAVVSDTAVGYYVYALDHPLAPGNALNFTFDVAFRQRGFTNDRLQTDVVRNGAYFDRRWLPFIGYQPLFELTGADARAEFGLPRRQPMPGPDDPGARNYTQPVREADRINVDMVIGTAGDQTPLSTGVLRRSWMENGRRYVHYASEGPTSIGPVFSARYAVTEGRWNDVALQVFHHPAHGNVAPTMIKAMQASLEYFSKEFGPYAFSQLRIVEAPPYSVFGRAHAGTVVFSEEVFFSRDVPGEFDQTFYGTAHEVAHQWWPLAIQPAWVRGAAFMSEGLANYSAVAVTEKTFGAEAARRMYDFHMERYRTGRADQSREVPLLEVENQTYIMYRKGPVAMWSLRERIGIDAVNAALRRFVAKSRPRIPPYPTSRELYAELRAVTPDSVKPFLEDMFEKVTLWDVKTERASVEASGSAFTVTLEVVAKKMTADTIGNATEAPMDDLVEIGVFGEGEGRLGEQLYLESHRIRSGKQTITITVPKRPVRAGVDPWRKLIDREREDNVRELAR